MNHLDNVYCIFQDVERVTSAARFWAAFTPSVKSWGKLLTRIWVNSQQTVVEANGFIMTQEVVWLSAPGISLSTGEWYTVRKTEQMKGYVEVWIGNRSLVCRSLDPGRSVTWSRWLNVDRPWWCIQRIKSVWLKRFRTVLDITIWSLHIIVKWKWKCDKIKTASKCDLLWTLGLHFPRLWSHKM